jgi:hypothetical protein
MPTSHWKVHLFAAVLTVLGVACREAPVAPSLSGAPLFSMGNSDAAHACQQGGYQHLFRTDGTSFKNAGDCTSYAAQGGTLADRVATFTNVQFGACNNLTWGYELDGAGHDFETFAGGCGPAQPGSDQMVGFLSTQTLRVFLRDNTCSFTFFEDGNHAVVTGSNPYDIKIADGGGICERGPGVDATGDIIASGSGNLNVTKTIS